MITSDSNQVVEYFDDLGEACSFMVLLGLNALVTKNGHIVAELIDGKISFDHDRCLIA